MTNQIIGSLERKEKGTSPELVDGEKTRISETIKQKIKAQYRFRVGESKNGGRNISTSTMTQDVTRYLKASILKLKELE